jgi:hypothetical protein
VTKDSTSCSVDLARQRDGGEMVQEHANNHHHLQQQLAKYGGTGSTVNGPGPGVSATGVARASRKNKPKKIPQRGLGVAQLEKLRIEEQKKMGGSGTATPSAHAGGLCQLPTLHHLPPPAPPLSALSRPAADGGAHCGFRPVLWSPVDPTKHPYKRSLCPQPPLPMVRRVRHALYMPPCTAYACVR